MIAWGQLCGVKGGVTVGAALLVCGCGVAGVRYGRAGMHVSMLATV